MRYPKSGEEWSIDEARARLERRQSELQRLLDWLDTDPSGPHPVPAAFLPVDPLECDGGVEQLELRAVERALARIGNLTYGQCDCCGGPIELSRLAAVPWSRCCVECIAFWEGALRTAEAEQSGCATCRAQLAAGDVLASTPRDPVLARR
jgi:DnaK suppressor protein